MTPNRRQERYVSAEGRSGTTPPCTPIWNRAPSTSETAAAMTRDGCPPTPDCPATAASPTCSLRQPTPEPRFSVRRARHLAVRHRHRRRHRRHHVGSPSRAGRRRVVKWLTHPIEGQGRTGLDEHAITGSTHRPRPRNSYQPDLTPHPARPKPPPTSPKSAW